MKVIFFYIFVPTDFDIWTSDLHFAALLSSASLYCHNRSLRLSYFEKIGGAGGTNRRTDGRGSTLNAAPL